MRTMRNLWWRLRLILTPWRWQLLSASASGVGLMASAGHDDSVSTGMLLVLGSVALLLAVRDVRDEVNAVRSLSFSPRGARSVLEERIIEQYRESPSDRVISLGECRLVVIRTMSKAIREDSLKVAGTATYLLPEILRPIGDAFVFQRVRQDRRMTDDAMLGWGRTSDNGMQVLRGSYADYLSTNHLAGWRTTRNGRPRPEYGELLYLDPNRERLVDLDDSLLFNGIGVNTIAITTDGCLVLLKETHHNTGPGRFARPLAPSGSGGLEPVDIVQTGFPVRHMLLAGAERELREEASVRADEIECSDFLGFGRWLDKGASPEAFAVTFLRIDSSVIRGREPGLAERRYVGEILTRPLRLAVGDQPTSMIVAVEGATQGVSLPLQACLLLAAEEIEAGTPTGERLRERIVPSVPSRSMEDPQVNRP